MWITALIPFAMQAITILVDEGYFHLKRGLPKWERIGHPMDTLSVLFCMGYVLLIPFSKGALLGYIFLASFSSILVTKDELVHKEYCPGSEMWLHALLFTLHPITLIVAGFIWPVTQSVDVPSWMQNWLNNPEMLKKFLWGQFSIMASFMIYQIVYWNFLWIEKPLQKQ